MVGLLLQSSASPKRQWAAGADPFATRLVVRGCGALAGPPRRSARLIPVDLCRPIEVVVVAEIAACEREHRDGSTGARGPDQLDRVVRVRGGPDRHHPAADE